MNVYTIGFAKRSAKEFFGSLKANGIRTLIDIRLLNTSHLAGYTKKEDLIYFLSLIGIKYIHEKLLAPDEELLNGYKKYKTMDWNQYEKKFNQLISSRKIGSRLDKAIFDQSCLLCSENKPDKCHRRLVANYLKEIWGDIEVIHL